MTKLFVKLMKDFPINKYFKLSKWINPVLCILPGLILFSCSNDKAEKVSLSDESLFKLSNTTAGYRYFKDKPDTLLKDVSSPHGPYVRIRFNNIAVAAMNNDYSNLATARFPDGSVVVKEVYNTPGGVLQVYAVMFKSSVDNNSGAGWIWGEYKADGETIYSTNRKGEGCTGCHSAPGNVDLIRTFSLH